MAASSDNPVGPLSAANQMKRPLAHQNRKATALGSGLTDQSQKMTVAASATAEKKTVGQRS
jgi:hypothetical protein